MIVGPSIMRAFIMRGVVALEFDSPALDTCEGCHSPDSVQLVAPAGVRT